MQVVQTVTQTLNHPYAGTYFGPGKIHQLKRIIQETHADYLIVNDELSPSQIRNLEKMTSCNIIDRTGLILEIFAHRARTREAKLQIRLARLKYQLPRLRTSASVRLDQQTGTGGGSYTNRGSGEPLIEMKRRTIMQRIYNVRHHLKATAKTKRVQSQRRKTNPIPNVALVGYTNAGKSTVMDQLIRRFSPQQAKPVQVKNMLFATLSTEVRKLQLPNQRTFMLSDTVGFVSKLPHELISAFRSTLSEAANADLLIQVVDYSSPDRQLMMQTTYQTLHKIGIHDVPIITIFNKADRTNTKYPVQAGNDLIMSAKDPNPESINQLVRMISQKIYHHYVTQSFLIPFAQGQLVADLNSKAQVIHTKYLNQGTLIKVNLPQSLAKRFQKYRDRTLG